MILLDTNVVSEPLKEDSDPAVLTWLDAQPVEALFLSTISLAELRFGIAILPAGKRKDGLRVRLDQRVLPTFGDRILPFGSEAAEAHAELRARMRAAGRVIGPADSYIAAIAAAHNLIVATRDTRPFVAAGLTVINPWRE